MKLLMLLAMFLFLAACADKQIITDTKLIKIKPPLIVACERLTIKQCRPTTNGELFECALEITEKLSLCADQTDALVIWQKVND